MCMTELQMYWRASKQLHQHGWGAGNTDSKTDISARQYWIAFIEIELSRSGLMCGNHTTTMMNSN